MLDRVRPSLLAGLKSRAGVAASRPTEIRPAGDEQVIVRETEARVTAISDRAELAFIYEAGFPHGGGGLRCQVQAEIAILVHVSPALTEGDAVLVEHSLQAGQAFTVSNRRKPHDTRTIGITVLTTVVQDDLIRESEVWCKW